MALAHRLTLEHLELVPEKARVAVARFGRQKA